MLTFLSLSYLALPYLALACGWLWWPYATVVGLVVLAGLASTYWMLDRQPLELPPSNRNGVNPVFIAAITAGLLYLSGVGGLGYQQPGDWIKHNAVLHDLTVNDWPVQYVDVPGVPQGRYLTYYIAYYLPAAVVGRIVGLVGAHLALAAWTYCGLLLTAAWIGRLLGSRSWLLWAGWFALSGMDALGVAVRGGGDWTFLEWWAALGQYSSNASLLVWVPQHALPGWIATAVIVDHAERRRDLASAGFAAALTGLWSPFVTIGLVPLAVVILLRGRLRTALSLQNLVASPVILLICVAYLASVERGQVPNQWNITWYDWHWFLKMLPLFWLLEFGVYAILLYPSIRSEDQRPPGASWNRAWFWMAVATLTVLPLYRIGILNDLVMRASIPSLFVFWILVLRLISSAGIRSDQWRGSLLLACLFVGAIQPFYQFAVQASGTPRHPGFAGGSPQVTIARVPEKFLPQYLAGPTLLPASRAP